MERTFNPHWRGGGRGISSSSHWSIRRVPVQQGLIVRGGNQESVLCYILALSHPLFHLENEAIALAICDRVVDSASGSEDLGLGEMLI